MTAVLQPSAFEALFEALEDPVVVFRTSAHDGPRIVHANPAYAALKGADRRALEGRSLGSLLAGVAVEARRTVEDAFEEGHLVEVPLLVGEQPFRLRLSPLLDGSWAAILRDLSPIRDLRANLLSRALRDGLTGLWNRQAWTEQAEARFAESTRYQRPLSVLILDLDHFKNVNDSHGHATGDAVLQAVCGACRGAVRRVDLLGRVGGEELALVAPDTGVAGASTLGVRICNAVRRIRVSAPEGPLSVTISVGVAERSIGDGDLGDLMGRADAALYRAKAEGRDRVVVA